MTEANQMDIINFDADAAREAGVYCNKAELGGHSVPMVCHFSRETDLQELDRTYNANQIGEITGMDTDGMTIYVRVERMANNVNYPKFRIVWVYNKRGDDTPFDPTLAEPLNPVICECQATMLIATDYNGAKQ